jgi:hypothetical protein
MNTMVTIIFFLIIPVDFRVQDTPKKAVRKTGVAYIKIDVIFLYLVLWCPKTFLAHW